MNRLDPRVRLIWLSRVVLLALIVGVGVAVVDRLVRPLPGPAAVVAAGIVLIVGGAYVLLRYRRWGWEVREDSLYLERGVFTRVRTVVPFVRIQHVDSSRRPTERLLGLSSVVVYTAGSRGADVTVPGLLATDASDLQERLKRLAIRAEGDDAV